MQQRFLPLLCFTFLSMAWMIKIADNTKLEVIAIMLDDRHQMQIKNIRCPMRVTSEKQHNVSKQIYTKSSQKQTMS